MPPPASFIDITPIPFTRLVTVAEFNVANEIWFRFITTVRTAFGQWAQSVGGVNLIAVTFQSDGSTVISSVSAQRGFWQELDAGTYYIRLRRSPQAPIAADFTYEADTRTINPATIPENTVFINDDNAATRAGALMSADGTVQGFNNVIPAGEIGDALPSGYLLYHDRFGKYTAGALILINPNLTHKATLVPPVAFFGPVGVSITNDGTNFYAIDGTEGFIYRITTAGVMSASLGTIPEILADGRTCVGISNNGNLVYFATPGDDKIQQFNITTATTSTVYTVPGFQLVSDDIGLTVDGNPGEIISLPDGTLVFWWIDFSAAGKTRLVHITAAGVLINSVEIFDPATELINHIWYASHTASTHIKLWLFVNSVSSKIGNFNLSTEVFDNSFTVINFFAGQNLGATNDNTKLGMAASCPMVTLSLGGPQRSIFIPRTDKKTDTDTFGNDIAIPNPTFKTALLP